jgi:hypothetical protein
MMLCATTQTQQGFALHLFNKKTSANIIFFNRQHNFSEPYLYPQRAIVFRAKINGYTELKLRRTTMNLIMMQRQKIKARTKENTMQSYLPTII